LVPPRSARGAILVLSRLNRLFDDREITVGDEPMPWIAIKLHIRAVRSVKDSDNGSTAAFGEITLLVDYANAIADVKVLRLRHCTLLTISMLWKMRMA
jgi:hypothetical protein